MQRGVLILAFLVATACLLIGIRLNVYEARKPALEIQLAQVLDAQKTIAARLENIEKEQKNIATGLQNIQRPTRMPEAPQRPVEDLNKVYEIPQGASLIKGEKTASVTIVEFSDFQCPFSKRFHTVILDVLKAYPKDVKFIFKNFPLGFHQNAKPAAKATLAAAEQGKYWEMVELIFENQASLSAEKFVELAGQLKLNVEKFKNDLQQKDAQYEKMIQDDMSLGMSVEVPGTPTFYLNGKKTRARDLETFKSEIDAILKK